MIAKIKLYIILGVVVAVVGLSTYYLKTYTFVKNSEVKAKSDSIRTEQKKVKQLDSTVFSISQDLDICKANDTKLKIVIAEQKKQASKTLLSENSCCAEVMHLEKTGMIKHDTVYLNILGNVPKRYKK